MGPWSRRLHLKADRVLMRGTRGVVLLYHRVANELSDPYGLCVTPEVFEAQLQVIRREGHPMALIDFVEARRKGSLPDRAICVTFDDGYLDNLEVAVPLLEQYDVPATIFITTGDGGRKREFWWDELARILLQPGRLPDSLAVEIGGERRRWSLTPDTSYDRHDQERHRNWHLSDATTPTRRHALFRDIYSLLLSLSADARTTMLDKLLSWGGQDPAVVRHSHRVMTPAQVAALASGGRVEIGAHTVTHTALPALTAGEQLFEIEQSRRDLEAWTGRKITSFAYPYGLYDRSSVDAARGAGFAFACSCIHEPVWRASDPFLLPRIEVTPRVGDGLASLLRRQFA